MLSVTEALSCLERERKRKKKRRKKSRNEWMCVY